MKKNKLILVFSSCILGSVILFILTKLNPFFVSLIYWWVLGLYIVTIRFFKLYSTQILLYSFGLFMLSAVLTTLRITDIAEIIMRLSLIGWLVGYTHSVLEYFFKRV